MPVIRQRRCSLCDEFSLEFDSHYTDCYRCECEDGLVSEVIISEDTSGSTLIETLALRLRNLRRENKAIKRDIKLMLQIKLLKQYLKNSGWKKYITNRSTIDCFVEPNQSESPIEIMLPNSDIENIQYFFDDAINALSQVNNIPKGVLIAQINAL